MGFRGIEMKRILLVKRGQLEIGEGGRERGRGCVDIG